MLEDCRKPFLNNTYTDMYVWVYVYDQICVHENIYVYIMYYYVLAKGMRILFQYNIFFFCFFLLCVLFVFGFLEFLFIE